MTPHFTYLQSTGELFDFMGNFLGEGYSGHGAGLNNPAVQAMRNVGPIPVGIYTCAKAVDHTTLGPIAVPLAPFPTNKMFGRTGFYCHGDNAQLNRSASEGCIIMPAAIRAKLIQGTVIQVVSGPQKPATIS